MRIVFVQKIAGVAGSENYFFQVLPGLIERGHEVVFLAFIDARKKSSKHDEFLQNLPISTFHIEP